MNILIVDDSKDLSDAIAKCLKSQNYCVDTAYDGKSGLRKALTNEYDIVLLDIMMPQMNGYEVLKKLKAEGRHIPTIMITAKNDITDIIEGLEMGADDYLQKPFNIDVLTAKIRALARRSNMSDFESDIIKYGDFILKIPTRKMSTDKLEITLSETECEMMRYLIKNSTVIVSPEKLAEALSQKEDTDEKTACNCANRLAGKLRYICSAAKIIEIKEMGYKLCC